MSSIGWGVSRLVSIICHWLGSTIGGLLVGKFYGEVAQLTSLVKSLIWPIRNQCWLSQCHIRLYDTYHLLCILISINIATKSLTY